MPIPAATLKNVTNEIVVCLLKKVPAFLISEEYILKYEYI